MNPRHVGLLVFPALALGLLGCSPKEPAPAATGRDSVAGLSWAVPADWAVQGPRTMRIATYLTPSAEGDADPGEVAVFYFGPQEGGSVEANIARWFNQFDQEDGRPTREVAESELIRVGDLPVTVVRAAGTYNAAAGPMAPRADMRAGYRLIGAIVEGPQGAVFFKFTGPASTIASQEAVFFTMVNSLARE